MKRYEQVEQFVLGANEYAGNLHRPVVECRNLHGCAVRVTVERIIEEPEAMDCWYCGEKPSVDNLYDLPGGKVSHQVKCNNCGVSGPRTQTRKAAIEDWNRRA